MVNARSVQRELRALHSAVDRVNRQVAERLGVNRTDLQCLDLIAQHGPLSPGRLAELLVLPSGTVTTVIDRVERAGLAVRERGGTDRRRVTVSLTPVATQRLAGVYAPLVRASADNLNRFDADDLALIADFVRSSVELTEAFSPAQANGSTS